MDNIELAWLERKIKDFGRKLRQNLHIRSLNIQNLHHEEVYHTGPSSSLLSSALLEALFIAFPSSQLHHSVLKIHFKEGQNMHLLCKRDKKQVTVSS